MQATWSLETTRPGMLWLPSASVNEPVNSPGQSGNVAPRLAFRQPDPRGHSDLWNGLAGEVCGQRHVAQRPPSLRSRQAITDRECRLSLRERTPFRGAKGDTDCLTAPHASARAERSAECLAPAHGVGLRGTSIAGSTSSLFTGSISGSAASTSDSVAQLPRGAGSSRAEGSPVPELFSRRFGSVAGS